MTLTFLEQSLEAEDRHWIMVVATIDGTPVATCQLLDWKAVAPYVASLHVDPNHRGKGIGSAMLRGCIESCKRFGKQAIAIGVRHENIRAISLYRRVGFRTAMTSDKTIWMSMPLD